MLVQCLRAGQYDHRDLYELVEQLTKELLLLVCIFKLFIYNFVTTTYYIHIYEYGEIITSQLSSQLSSQLLHIQSTTFEKNLIQ